MKASADHVYYDGADGEIRCRHCEDRSALTDGATAELLLLRLRGFLLMHKLCRPAPLPDRQMSLPHTEPDRFEELYPLATDHGGLWHILREVLTEEQWEAFPAYCPWDPRSGVFNAVANWARIEKAHQDSEQRSREGLAGVPGLTIPAHMPMPALLAEMLGEPAQPKKKRRARTPEVKP